MRLSCFTCSAASTDFGAGFSYRHELQICSTDAFCRYAGVSGDGNETRFTPSRAIDVMKIPPMADFTGHLPSLLAACESGVWPFVHLLQVRQRIRGQLLSIVLSGSAERTDISNNFLSGLRHPLGVQLADQPVGVQCPVNYFIHGKLQKIPHCV